MAVVAVKHPDPRFEGQTKTKLDNPDAEKVTKSIAGEQLTLFFDKNLETLKNVISKGKNKSNEKVSNEYDNSKIIEKVEKLFVQ